MGAGGDSDELGRLYLRFMFDLVARRPFDALHWGDFSGIPHQVARLSEAQQQYTERLIAFIPDSVETVLDVGCGLGAIAQRLAADGRRVTALSPEPDHCEAIAASGVDGLEVRCTRFEEFAEPRRFDLLLFAESLNFFVERDAAGHCSVTALLQRCRQLMSAGGYVLAADILSEPAVGALEAQQEFSIRERCDITEPVAFTASALQQLIERYVHPAHALLVETVRARDPELASRLQQTLAEVPNKALRELLAGRAVEPELLERGRYLIYLLH